MKTAMSSFGKGNTDMDFFKLIRGALAVIKGGKKIAELTEPGEYFGEMAAISGEQRTATIISQGRSTIKRFPGDKIDEIIEKYPDVSSHLFKTMTNRTTEIESDHRQTCRRWRAETAGTSASSSR